MPLKDNYWMDVPEDEIPTKVGVIGLSVISAQTTNELIRQGWYSSPAIALLYEKTSAGVWIARTNASGLVTEAYSQANGLYTIDQRREVFATRGAISVDALLDLTSSANLTAWRKHIKQVALNTDGAGACAATVLHTGPTGYYPVVRLKQIISTVADAATTLTITVTGGALVGPATRVIALVANVMLDLGDTLLYNLTDTSVISIQISDGPISSTVNLEIEYWSET